ncbi:zinc finger BED domain-containing protein 4-like isoform X2 [Cottoperca gobio]|uniref:Zinc finger BED domain-containing protein 4-like isoform X2 n=1 Tax=Cottoperca gobio TaxID=56716 RepID=A0A6J2Q2Y8_COTGO|nr:zinc finger BED domain-containing protein 4-like isoform X2 [Cottoperca gobio]
MVIEDSQPFTIVEDKGFRTLVKAFSPNYVLPTRQERLTKVQEQMGRPALKLIQEVDTRWNSTYHMLQRFYDLREPVGAALAGLRTEVAPLSSRQYEIIAECLKVLSPFNDATVELSEEKRVSGSKVIPLLLMLHHALEEEEMGLVQTPESTAMAESLRGQLREKLNNLQSMRIISLATVLDPRFKKTGFFSPNKAAEAEKRLTSECTAVMRNSASSSSSSSSTSQPHISEASQPVTQGSKLASFGHHSPADQAPTCRCKRNSGGPKIPG